MSSSASVEEEEEDSSSSLEILEASGGGLDKEKAKKRIKMVMQSLVASQDEDEVFTVLFSTLVKAKVLTQEQLNTHRAWVVEVTSRLLKRVTEGSS